MVYYFLHLKYVGSIVTITNNVFIYTASNEIRKSVGPDAHYAVKVEPHKNGPLFVEMNFYIRAAKSGMSKCFIQLNM